MGTKEMTNTKTDLPQDNRLPMVKERRLGIIRISREFVESVSCDVWDLLMRNVRIVDSDFDIFSNSIRYQCYSPWFDPCPEGQFLGEYLVEFRNDYETGQIELTRVSKVFRTKEFIEDDQVLERIKSTIHKSV